MKATRAFGIFVIFLQDISLPELTHVCNPYILFLRLLADEIVTIKGDPSLLLRNETKVNFRSLSFP
jgi:hypothetical protein